MLAHAFARVAVRPSPLVRGMAVSTADEIAAALAPGRHATVVDLRSAAELTEGVPVAATAVNLPWDREAGCLTATDGLPADKSAPVLVH